ncbi:alpha/beta fold hydrolase [Microbacterium album]|uniref:Alpha/beta hydrolase n=1 Tax=Microbacterium album TaxID=2053191 RepID=A0A917IIZ0_9MICO|nr:alpha/beta fold hydrolase [Microbacterium album]GGH48837.1 alpha/beta hydrolase [Microbacterium album]
MPEFVDDHGVAIVYDVHPARGGGDAPGASGPVRGVVQLLHGVGEHAGRYGAVIDGLTAAGFSVYAADHRGHGRTGMRQHGDAAKLGRLGVGGHRAAVAACRRLGEIIREEHPSSPLILLGHSWGSFVAQMLLDRDPERYDALILSGSALRWPGSLNPGDLNAQWKTPGAMGTEWLSSDLSVGRAFLDDPLTTTVPLRKLFGVVDAARLFGLPRRGLRALAGHDIPVLLMVGRDDPVGGPHSVHRLARAYRERSGLEDITTLVYPDARHEIFNEVGQAAVRADLLAWLDARFPAP